MKPIKQILAGAVTVTVTASMLTFGVTTANASDPGSIISTAQSWRAGAGLAPLMQTTALDSAMLGCISATEQDPTFNCSRIILPAGYENVFLAAHPAGTDADSVVGSVGGGISNIGSNVIGSISSGNSLGIAVGREIPAQTVPGAPLNAFIAPENQTSATVGWEPPANDGGSNIQGYTVTLSGGPNPSQTAQVAPDVFMSATFPDLAPGSYTATIVAVNSLGQGEVALTGTIEILDASETPLELTTYRIVDAGDNNHTIEWTWSAPEELTDQSLTINGQEIGSIGAAATSFVVDTSSDTSFQVELTGYTDTQNYPQSFLVQTEDNEVIYDPVSPTEISPAADGVVVEYPETLEAAFYSIDVRTAAGVILDSQATGSAEAGQVTFTGLTADTEYQLVINTYYNDGAIVEGSPAPFMTLPAEEEAVAPEMPSGLVEEYQTNGDTVISWDAIENATSYVVEVFANNRTVEVETITLSDNTHTLPYNAEYEEYTVNVTAVNDDSGLRSDAAELNFGNLEAPSTPVILSGIVDGMNLDFTVDVQSWGTFDNGNYEIIPTINGVLQDSVYVPSEEAADGIITLTDIFVGAENDDEYSFTIIAGSGDNNILASEASDTWSTFWVGEPEETVAPGQVTEIRSVAGLPHLGNGEMVLSWTPPADSGSSNLDSYIIEYTQASSGVTQRRVVVHTPGEAVQAENLYGLEANEEVRITVTAVNGTDTGQPAEYVTTTPFYAPGAATDQFFTYSDRNDPNRVTINWEAPQNTGEDDAENLNYELRIMNSAGELATDGVLRTRDTNYTVTLDKDEQYTVTLITYNTNNQNRDGDTLVFSFQPGETSPAVVTGAVITQGTNFLRVNIDSDNEYTWMQDGIQYNVVLTNAETGEVLGMEILGSATSTAVFNLANLGIEIGDKVNAEITTQYGLLVSNGSFLAEEYTVEGVVPKAINSDSIRFTPLGDGKYTARWSWNTGENSSFHEGYAGLVDADGEWIGTPVAVNANVGVGSLGTMEVSMPNPNTSYRFAVKLNNVPYITTADAFASYTTPYGVPDTVSNIQFNSDTRVLTWDAPEDLAGASTYEAQVSVTKTGGQPVTTPWVGNSPVSADLTSMNLTPGEYNVTVTNRTTPNAPQTVSTSSTFTVLGTAPSVAQNISYNPATRTVSWNPPADDGGSNVTYVAEMTGAGESYNSGVLNETSWVHPDTVPANSEITFVVVTVNSVGSTRSTPVTVTTEAGAPSAVRNITFDASNQEFTWDAPADNGGDNGQMIYYGAVTYDDPVNGRQGETFQTTDARYKVRMMLPPAPGTEVTLVISAHTAAGSSPTTGFTTEMPTLAPSAVSGLAFNPVNNLLIWEAPSSLGNSPTVEYRGVVQIGDEEITFGPQADLQAAINLADAAPGSTVTMGVQAVTPAGVNSEWRSITVDIPAVAPSEVRDLTFNPETGAITWAAPANDGGNETVEYHGSIAYANGDEETFGNQEELTYIVGAFNPAPGSTVTIRVQATSDAGDSDWVTVTYDAPAVAPSEVRNLTFNDTENRISWSAPANDGGNETIKYYGSVRYENGDETVFNSEENLSYVVGDFNPAPGSTVTIRVKALSDAGDSDWSTITYDAPAVAPSEVRDIAFNLETGVVSWATPANDGGNDIVEYHGSITYANGDEETFGNQEELTYVISGEPAPGSTIVIRIQATSDAGDSGWMTLSADIPAVAPSVVTELAFDAATSTVLWEAPANDGGNDTVEYSGEVTYSNGLKQSFGPQAELSFVLSEYTPEPGLGVTVRVQAVTEAGNSGWVTVTHDEPAVAPDAVTDVVATVTGDTSATVKWEAPTYAGGAAITAYEYVLMDGSTVVKRETATGTQVSLDGLQKNTEYRVTVAAINSAGESNPVASNAFKTVPVTVPVAMTDEELAEYMEEPSAEQLTNVVKDDTISVTFGDDYNGLFVGGMAHSEPEWLGWALVQNGVATFNIADLTPGDHTFVAYDRDGNTLGHTDFVVAEAPNNGGDPGTPGDGGTPGETENPGGNPGNGGTPGDNSNTNPPKTDEELANGGSNSPWWSGLSAFAMIFFGFIISLFGRRRSI